MILTILVILAFLITILYLFLGPIATNTFAWWQPMVAYAISFIIAFVLFLLFLAIASMFHSKKDQSKKVKQFYRIIAIHICKLLQQVFRLDLVVEGMDRFPTDGNYLFVCNHQSNFDPIVALWVLRKEQVPLVMKNNILKIPIVGRWLLAMGCVPIDRKNNRKTIEAISFACKEVKSGKNFGIFPEGTRSRTHKMLPFRNGAFRIAEKGQAPIVVCIVDGMYKVKKRFPFRKTKVLFRFCEVVPYETIKDIDTVLVGKMVHEIMEKNIMEARKENAYLIAPVDE